MNVQHLSDEQFCDLLSGESANTAAAAHLEACASCRCELNTMRSATGTLRTLSLRWAEEHSKRILTPSRWALGWHGLPAWSAAAAVLLCGLAMGVRFQGVTQPAASEVSQSQAVAAAPSEDELVEDNQLLRSIDRELSRQVRPQVPASELTVSSGAVHHPVLREVSN